MQNEDLPGNICILNIYLILKLWAFLSKGEVGLLPGVSEAEGQAIGGLPLLVFL
jgi:hypothetical protein